MKTDDGREFQYIPMPKNLSKKLRETKLSERERKLVDVIIEQTLGYEAYKDNSESVRRTSKPLASRYLATLTGFPRSTVNYEIDRLAKRNIVTIEDGWFKKQRTRVIGINMELRQWDNSNFMPMKEYIKLHKEAKSLAKEWWENHNSDYQLIQGGRRDKADFKLLKNGVQKGNVSVIVKVTWDEEINWDKLTAPDKPNTIFCFVNRPMTRMAVIEPGANRDLKPKDGYLVVPREKNPQGNSRIKIIPLLSPEPQGGTALN